MNPSIAGGLWACAGLVAGTLQAGWLWRAARRWRAPSVLTLARLPVVVGTLVGAAVAGALVPAVAGWAAGLGGAGVLLVLRGDR